MQRLGVVFARVAQPCQPSPVPRPDRPAHRPFRGLLSVHSRCGLHTRTVTVCRDRYPKASDTSSPPCLLRSLPAGAVAGWGLHPLEKRRLVTAHVDCGPSRIPQRTTRSPMAGSFGEIAIERPITTSFPMQGARATVLGAASRAQKRACHRGPRLRIAERHFRDRLLDIPQQVFGYQPRKPTRLLPSARA